MAFISSNLSTKHGLWPREVPRQTKSEAEKKVYDAIKTCLPKDWYAWHSLKLRTRIKGTFSEADFVIADPSRLNLGSDQSKSLKLIDKIEKRGPKSGLKRLF